MADQGAAISIYYSAKVQKAVGGGGGGVCHAYVTLTSRLHNVCDIM